MSNDDKYLRMFLCKACLLFILSRPIILRHSRIRRAADEAVLNIAHYQFSSQFSVVCQKQLFFIFMLHSIKREERKPIKLNLSPSRSHYSIKNKRNLRIPNRWNGHWLNTTCMSRYCPFKCDTAFT